MKTTGELTTWGHKAVKATEKEKRAGSGGLPHAHKKKRAKAAGFGWTAPGKGKKAGPLAQEKEMRPRLS